MAKAIQSLIASLEPVLYWPLDDTGSTAVDRSGNGRNGAMTNNPILRRLSKSFSGDGYSVNLDGSGQKVLSTYAPAWGAPITVVLFVSVDSYASARTLISSVPSSGGVTVIATPTPELLLQPLGNSATGQVNFGAALCPPTGTMAMLAVAIDDAADLVYASINGAPWTTAAMATACATGSPVQIGAAGVAGNPLAGDVAHFAIFDRILAESELRKIYKTGAAGVTG